MVKTLTPPRRLINFVFVYYKRKAITVISEVFLVYIRHFLFGFVRNVSKKKC